MNRATRERAGTAVLLLALLPFVGFAALVALWAARAAAAGQAGSAAALAAFALTFAATAAGVVRHHLRRMRAAREAEARRSAFPDEPWRWRVDWLDGSARPMEPPLARRAGLFLLIAVPFSALFTWRAIATRATTPLPVAAWLTILLFDACALAGLGWTLRQRARARRYGAALLRFPRLPVPLGGALEATLDVPGGLAPSAAVTARVVVARQWRARSGGAAMERVLWSGPAHAGVAPGGRTVTLGLALPADLPPSDPVPAATEVTWRLEVVQEAPGADFVATFALPVFRVDAPPPA
ncbi:MAG: hypothetical protein NW201_07875 [Gemmatimonadales bacterium]|nr:hypothetical protein [Gemmatimonadales bacterium]